MIDHDEYLRYIASSAWEAKRRAVWARCDGTCERCGCCAMEETAHLTYERLKDELPEDLAGLCIPCHRFIDDWRIPDDEDHASHARSICTLNTTTAERTMFECVRLGADLAASREHTLPFLLTVLVEGVSDIELHLGRWDSVVAAREARTWSFDTVRPAWDTDKPLKRDRPRWSAVCPDCGIDTEVPFEPRSRYARCIDCWREARSTPV